MPDDFDITKIIIAVINVIVAVSGWLYASRSQDQRTKSQAKNSEVNRLIDKIEDVFDELMIHISDEWLTDEAITDSYQKRVALISKINFLIKRIRKVDSSYPSVDPILMRDLRQLLTNDQNTNLRKKNITAGRIIGLSEKFLDKYDKKF
ncbi:hypothetical protein ACU5DF_02995 [Aliivibrio wodanis]|uniref:hypothetical protein n=1 Tax=Aliivibrio wodanis TaxID=80852 RepID=UPI00406C5D75